MNVNEWRRRTEDARTWTAKPFLIMCRRLASAQRHASMDASPSMPNAIDNLLASMGGKAPPPAPKRAEPKTEGVGELVWDPSAISQRDDAPAAHRTSPDVNVELLRAHALRRLQAAAEKAILDELGDRICAKLELLSRVTLRNGNGLIDRWLAGRRAHGTAADDVLLPPPHRTAAEVPEFVAELEAAGASASSAAAAAGALGSASSDAVLWLNRQRRNPVPDAVVRIIRPQAAAAASANGSAVSSAGGTAKLRCGKTSLTLNEAHLLKLHELYRRTSGVDIGLDDPAFRACVFCALQRYESLGGAGLQAALSPRAFDVLRDAFGVRAECFASPFNCRYDTFCSAFPDVDSPFGSLGDFFDRFGGGGGEEEEERILEGSFEANPPFVPSLIDRMANTMNAALRAAEKRRSALSFVVIVPAWSEGKSSDALTKSPFLRRTLIATNRKHEYCEGAQYKKPAGQLRKATCDTAVYCLQSDAGSHRWPATDAACNRLLEALCGGGGGGGVGEGSVDVPARAIPLASDNAEACAEADGADSSELVQAARRKFNAFVARARRLQRLSKTKGHSSLSGVRKSMRRRRARHLWRMWELVHRWRLRGGVPYG